jgi:putative PEP-CTERM system TPR-repeat lipoprotein
VIIRPLIILLCLLCSPITAADADQSKPLIDQSPSELKQSIRQSPLDPGAWYYLARSYLGFSTNNESLSVNQELETSGEFYEDALRYLETEEQDAAIIQLRNAIQIDPTNLSAYLLLAEIYQELRSPQAAEHFLRQAQINGADPALVAIPLAEAMLKSEMFEEILSDVSTTNLQPGLRAKVRVIQGKAMTALQNYEGAETAFNEALMLDPDLIRAKIELARVAAISGDRDTAWSKLEEVREAGQYLPAYWLIKAELEDSFGDTADAIRSYEEALVIEPDERLALTALAQLRLESGDIPEAIRLISALRKYYPKDLRGLQLELAQATAQGSPSEIENLIMTSKAIVDQIDYSKLQRDPLGLYVVGTIHHLSNRPAEAASVLASYMEFVPDDLNAMSMLIVSQLGMGQFDPALRTIGNAPESIREAPQFNSLSADVYIARKNYSAAVELLNQLIEHNPGDEGIRLKRAKVNANLGNFTIALSELEDLNHERNPEVRRALANLLLALGEYDRVLTLVSDAENSNILRGKALLAKSELIAARMSFESALKQNPESTEAQFNIAVIDRLEGNVDRAVGSLKRIIQNRPDHSLAMLQLSAIAQASGNNINAAKFLRNAIDIVPDRGNSIRLIELLLADNREQEARSVMSNLRIQFPTDMIVLATEAKLAIGTGNSARAKQIYINMRNLAIERDSIADLVDVARYQFSIDDRDEAYNTLSSGRRVDSKYIPLVVTQAEFAQNNGNLAEAIKLTDRIIELSPENPIGYRFKGDLLRRRGDVNAAVTAYALGIKNTQGSLALTLGYYELLREAKDRGEALKFLENYVGSQSAISYVVMRVLAAGYSDVGNYEKSIEIHNRLRAERPDDPILMNNLAMAYFLAGDERAQETAEFAYQLAPDNHAIMDTLGWILVNKGELSLGTTMLRNALARSTNEPDIRYHYAVALSRNGQTKAAIKELRLLLGEGRAFQKIEGARILLTTLLSE